MEKAGIIATTKKGVEIERMASRAGLGSSGWYTWSVARLFLGDREVGRMTVADHYDKRSSGEVNVTILMSGKVVDMELTQGRKFTGWSMARHGDRIKETIDSLLD